MPVEGPHRPALLDAKLRALVRGHWGDGSVEGAAAGTFPGGSALRAGRRGWVLAEDDPARGLGGALMWARRAGLTEVHLLASGATGLLARRAVAFSEPPVVWRVEGRTIERAEPDPVPAEELPDPVAMGMVGAIRAAGAEPLVEHGVLRAEVLGLEVGRVVVRGGKARLEVGVGKHDREGHRLVHGDDQEPALARVVAMVRGLRAPGVRSHQANQLAAERWLRAVVVSRPDLVGARTLAPVSPPVARPDLRRPAVAPAAGEDTDGRPLAVVCSVGIDVDLLPSAIDVRLADGRHPRLAVVVPEGDDHPVTRDLAAALVEPAEVVTVPVGWRELGR